MARRIAAAGMIGTLLLMAKVPVANAFTGRHLISAAGAIRETAASETGRITATSINLHDNMGDVVDLTTASGSILTQ